MDRTSASSKQTPHSFQSPQTAPRLLCATRYDTLGASSRLRLIQYAPALRQAGFSVSLRPFLSDDYLTALYAGQNRTNAVLRSYRRALSLRAQVKAHDLIWIEKELLPWIPYWLERGILRDKPYILDFDDAWALRYAASPVPLARLLLRNKFGHLLRHASLTIVGNQTLYEWAESEGAKNLLFLPTVIDLARYNTTLQPDGPFTIGWIGTPITAAYLTPIIEPLRQLATEAPLRLLIIGAPDFSLPGVEIEHHPWTEASEAALLTHCHVGIMPLPNDDWAKGKSGYKLIQYMACGRPAIASPIGANKTIIQQGENGFLATTEQDWLITLRQLRDNPALATKLGAAARHHVETYYSLGATAPKLINALNALADNIAVHRA